MMKRNQKIHAIVVDLLEKKWRAVYLDQRLIGMPHNVAKLIASDQLGGYCLGDKIQVKIIHPKGESKAFKQPGGEAV